MNGSELRCTNGPTGANPVRKSDAPRAESRVWVGVDHGSWHLFLSPLPRTSTSWATTTAKTTEQLRISMSNEQISDLKRKAKQGSADAQYNLGVLYANGHGVPQGYGTARQWYEKAAAQGHASAQYNLGVLYEKGQGVPQDYGTARRWWEQAAAKGDAMAQTNLGALYTNGQGVPRDYGTARRWWEQAAAKGDAMAQTNLGALYANGQGVPQDYVRAYMWYNLAAAHTLGTGDKLGADDRDVVARRMTPAQIAEAKKLAQKWKPKTP